jgi:hypothetical protein
LLLQSNDNNDDDTSRLDRNEEHFQYTTEEHIIEQNLPGECHCCLLNLFLDLLYGNGWVFHLQDTDILAAAVTPFYFRRTQQGGFAKDGIDLTKLKPIARWLQRRVMWITGLADHFVARQLTPKSLEMTVLDLLSDAEMIDGEDGLAIDGAQLDSDGESCIDI